MALIDTRNKRNGRTVVSAEASAVANAKLVVLKHKAAAAKGSTPAAKVKDKPAIVPGIGFDHACPEAGDFRPLSYQASADPGRWDALSKDVNYSISGLGSTRRFKRYPGKVFPMAAAVWRESAAEADRAAKAAVKAAANANKTASGAVTSL